MQLTLDHEALRPLVSQVVQEVVAQQIGQRDVLGDRLMLSESEAAELLGVQKYVLRDARLRGEIKGRLIGKRIFYSRQALVRFAESTGQ